ncbi:MAG TPA: hypothetical protein VN541_23910 [Tepidisphaeraceae bacterium]|nr:hypothetical protein [Tepidisphaeraceae bacterium]
MTYRGRIKQGTVVLEGPIQLPDGTEVEINTLPAAPAPSVWDKLLALAGKAEGLPEDAAEQVDHYLHGTPKR